MNIAFLIGNGFDINLGLKTSYKDFYEYYIKKPSNDPLIADLKEDIESDYATWVDLELELGRHLKCLKTLEEFDTVFDDIRISLAEYIVEEEKKFTYEIKNEEGFLNDLVFPESQLPLSDGNEIKRYKSSWAGSHWNINIITFNYTKVIESIFQYRNNFNIGTRGNYQSIFREIKHIHGCADDNIILGVNDVSQILNEGFKENLDIIEGVVKPECNKAMKHLVNVDCETIIKLSNLICIYGLSIGETDKIWWEIVGRHLLRSDSRLIIFAWSKEGIPVNHGQKLGRWTRPIKESFLEKTGLSEAEKKLISENIYIGYNTNIFDFKLEGKSTSGNKLKDILERVEK